MVEHDPETNDLEINIKRLQGRIDYRDGEKDCEHIPKGEKTQWWLGWYDETLRKIFGRE